MKKVLVLYATREGQAKKVAEYVAEKCAAHPQVSVEIRNAKAGAHRPSLVGVDGVVVVASVHILKHEPEVVQFVREHRAELAKIPSAFLSLSLSEAGAENPLSEATKREQAGREVAAMVDAFVDETGWQPSHVEPVAGALKYRTYNPLVRLVMRAIAKTEGGSTDVSRDWEYTDWTRLDTFAKTFLSALDGAKPVSSTTGV